jgi:hypothetical protein
MRWFQSFLTELTDEREYQQTFERSSLSYLLDFPTIYSPH